MNLLAWPVLSILVGAAVGFTSLLGWLTITDRTRTQRARNAPAVRISYMNVENQARLGTMPPSSRVVDPPIFG